MFSVCKLYGTGFCGERELHASVSDLRSQLTRSLTCHFRRSVCFHPQPPFSRSLANGTPSRPSPSPPRWEAFWSDTKPLYGFYLKTRNTCGYKCFTGFMLTMFQLNSKRYKRALPLFPTHTFKFLLLSVTKSLRTLFPWKHVRVVSVSLQRDEGKQWTALYVFVGSSTAVCWQPNAGRTQSQP